MADYRPLTREEFDDGCGYTHNDIPICEDEGGNWVYAYGHVDKPAMAAAVNAYDTEMGAEAVYSHTDVEHVWAVTEQPADAPDGWFIRWGDEHHTRFDADTPGAFPITIISR